MLVLARSLQAFKKLPSTLNCKREKETRSLLYSAKCNPFLYISFALLFPQRFFPRGIYPVLFAISFELIARGVLDSVAFSLFPARVLSPLQHKLLFIVPVFPVPYFSPYRIQFPLTSYGTSLLHFLPIYNWTFTVVDLSNNSASSLEFTGQFSFHHLCPGFLPFIVLFHFFSRKFFHPLSHWLVSLHRCSITLLAFQSVCWIPPSTLLFFPRFPYHFVISTHVSSVNSLLWPASIVRQFNARATKKKWFVKETFTFKWNTIMRFHL